MNRTFQTTENNATRAPSGGRSECQNVRLSLQRSTRNAQLGTQPEQVPPIVNDVLHSPGQPLDAATRSFFELRFGHDFSRVRVHADAKAAESATAVSSRAYTVGNDVIFAPGNYAPATIAGRNLLAHELTHVVQQTSALSASAGARNSSDEHEQEAEHSIRAIAAEEAPLVKTHTSAPALQRDADQSRGLTLPQAASPGLFPPGQQGQRRLNLGLDLRQHLMPSAISRINRFLDLHRFAVGTRLQPSLDGEVTTLEAVIDAVYPLILPIIPRADVEQYVRARWAGMVRNALLNPAIPPPPVQVPNLPSVQVPNMLAQPPQPTQQAENSQEITVTAASNFAYHVNLVSPPDSAGDSTLQFQISDSGRVQRVFQINYNVNSQQVQFVAGAQAAASAERNLIREILKVSGFVQVLAGVAWSGAPASGALTLQPATGGQLTLSFGAVQFAVQGAVGLNVTQGSATTLDIAVVPQISIPLGTERPRSRGPQSSELTSRFEIRDWVERARFSDLQRLPLEEKIRLVSTLLADGIVTYDADAVAKIWRSSSAYERTQLRPIIEPRITEAGTRVQEQLRRLLTEAR